MPLLTIWYCPALDKSTTVDPRRSSEPSSGTILPPSRTRSNTGHRSLKSYQVAVNSKPAHFQCVQYMQVSMQQHSFTLTNGSSSSSSRFQSTLTSTSSELCASLRLALVRARGPPQTSTSCTIGGYFGIRMPTRSQPGFRSAFREGCRENIVVTAPGNISFKTLVGTVTLAYLK